MMKNGLSFLLGPRSRFLYLFLWVALIGVALWQRAAIRTEQRKVDDDLLVLRNRRVAMERDMESKEDALKRREEELKVRLLHVEQSELEHKRKQQAGKDKVTMLEGVVKSLQNENTVLRRSVQALRGVAGRPAVPQPQVAPGFADAQHRHHAAKPENTVPAQLGGEPIQFDLNATAPTFLEDHFAGRDAWSFHRDNSSDVGILNLMPWPTKLSFPTRTFVGPARLRGGAAKSFEVAWSGNKSATEGLSNGGKQAISRLQSRVAALSKPGGSGGAVAHADLCQWKDMPDANAEVFSVRVVCDCDLPAVIPSAMNEQYTLNVTETGEVIVTAKEAVGVLRAFTTLTQLMTVRGDRIYLPVVNIEDAPVYSWRGLLLDVSRHFHPVEEILAFLEGMEYSKLNVLHWHLSDDQAFRFESRKFPKLTSVGAEGGKFFTQEQVKQVVSEAALRGIRVVPEFDMPGHVSTIVLAYPELAAGGKVPSSVPSEWGVLPYVLDVSREETFTWIESFVEEVVGLFPDEFYHIGGDEVPHSAWGDSASQSFMKSKGIGNIQGLQMYFNQRMNSILGRHNRKMVGWDEITGNWLPKNVTVQFWRGWMPHVANEIASLGLQSIASNELYLDWVRSVKQYYRHSIAGHRGRVGGEACMWSEWTSYNLDNRVWPSLAAIGERFWISNEAPGGTTHMYARLLQLSKALSVLGLRHEETYNVAVDAVLTGLEPSYADVVAWPKNSLSASLLKTDSDGPVVEKQRVLVRRFLNTLHPVSRVGAGGRHPLIDMIDALRPDSFEMRSLGFLCDQVTHERFLNKERASILRAYLVRYASLSADMEASGLFQKKALMSSRALVASISAIAGRAVELLDHLAARKEVQAIIGIKNIVLNDILRIENTVLGSDKFIVEIAHVLETTLIHRIH